MKREPFRLLTVPMRGARLLGVRVRNGVVVGTAGTIGRLDWIVVQMHRRRVSKAAFRRVSKAAAFHFRANGCHDCGVRVHFTPRRRGQRLGVRCLYCLRLYCYPCGDKHFRTRIEEYRG